MQGAGRIRVDVLCNTMLLFYITKDPRNYVF